jgi:signal transduction histidine kinase
VVSISDEGPGIAVEHLGRNFDSFTRGEGHAQPGVGLGLTIASQAAKLLGGKLAVESKIGEGSKFTLTLAT